MLADVYVLANVRSAALVRRFLEWFLPDRTPSASEYEVPEYANKPEHVFDRPDDLIRHCEAYPDLHHRICWSNSHPGSVPSHAHVYFLADGGLILGLSTPAGLEDVLLRQIMEFAGSEYGYI